MKDKLLRLGFLELACYLKKGDHAAGTDWEPMAELTGEEVRFLLMREYEQWRDGSLTAGPGEEGRLLGLSEAGAFCLLIMGLSGCSEDFKEALCIVDASVLKSAQILYEENHKETVSEADRRLLETLEAGEQTAAGAVASLWLKEEDTGQHLPCGWNWLMPLGGKEKDIWRDAVFQAKKISSFGKRRDMSAVCVCGPVGVGRTECARAWSEEHFEKTGKALLVDLDCEWTKSVQPVFCAVLAVLGGGVLCLEHMKGEVWPFWKPWARWMKSRGSLLFILGEKNGVQRGPLEEDEKVLPVFLKSPDMTERRRVWELVSKGYALEEGMNFDTLANQYRLTPGQIVRIFKMAFQRAGYMEREMISYADIRECCHRLLERDFGSRAMKVEPGYSLEDLVLPSYQKDKLLAACHQVRYRHQVLEQWGLGAKMAYGTGVSLIFAGPPGTGKTMAAQILAGQLGMELYRVELSAVVSKYIGETEKNLQQIFETAKESQVVLFFDEADVLFGKRTEVRDSNDKYSNMEAAFLLQKMEEYEGVAILATNLLKNIDEGFKRRMKFIVDFPFPGSKERLELWKRAIPRQLPVEEELDLEFLAEKFELSGSNIRNIVYHAGFLAAGAGRGVVMEDIIKALKNEYEKGDKRLTRQEAEPYGVYLECSQGE